MAALIKTVLLDQIITDMKITICGSIAFIREMEAVAKQLKALGHKVKSPPAIFVDGHGKHWDAVDYYKFKKSKPFNDPQFLQNHSQRIQDHFDCVDWCDAILVLNYDKNGVKNYIGPNTLIEMGVAFYLKKKIYLLNPIPELAWQEEVLGLKPVVINNNFTLIV
ncbi:MAG TPA: hypothetical protein VE973_02110 [Candidatus Limnocylindria bacterium]|nr:hypothetical protein [Candidatus Limnocylindria bacterium]